MRLRATDVFQLLVEGAAALSEEGITSERVPMQFDDLLGKAFGARCLERGIDQEDVWLAASVLARYCGRGALMSFSFEVEGEGFSAPEDFESAERLQQNRSHLKVEGFIDIEAMAKAGKRLGWRREWCPFTGAAEAKLWNKGFEVQPKGVARFLGFLRGW